MPASGLPIRGWYVHQRRKHHMHIFKHIYKRVYKHVYKYDLVEGVHNHQRPFR